jgi:hypothetical protein
VFELDWRNVFKLGRWGVFWIGHGTVNLIWDRNCCGLPQKESSTYRTNYANEEKHAKHGDNGTLASMEEVGGTLLRSALDENCVWSIFSLVYDQRIFDGDGGIRQARPRSGFQ